MLNLPLPVLLSAPLGIIDGLLVHALLCTVALGAGIWAWAVALGGRSAGVLAVILATAVPALVLAPRMLNFYPQYAATFVLAAAASTAAARRRTPAALLLAGTGLAACLLVDVRGLLWAAPMLLLVGAAALFPARGVRRSRAVGALLLPLVLSWPLGRLAWPGDFHLTLADQADTTDLMSQRGAALDPVDLDRPGFLWGHDGPAELLAMARFLHAEVSTPPPHEVVVAFEPEGLQLAWFVAPWAWLAAGAGLVLVGGLLLARRGWSVAAVALCVAPFAAALAGMAATWEVTARFLVIILPPVPVLLGVALSWVLEALAAGLPRRWRATAARALPAGAAVVVLAMTTGVLPGPLSPDAAWRNPPALPSPWGEVDTHVHQVVEALRGEAVEVQPRWLPLCVAALEEEAETRDPLQSRLYGGPDPDALAPAGRDPGGLP